VRSAVATAALRGPGLALAISMAACTGLIDGPAEPVAAPVRTSDASVPDAAVPAPPPVGRLDREAARARFVTTTDLMRYVIAPGCAAERNECHNSEDFPDLSTEGNLWNLVGLACNQGLGERTEVEGLCEARGDELRIEDGPNAGFTAVVGAIITMTDADGDFDHYEIYLDRPVPAGQSDGDFVFLRDGAPIAGLGGGRSLEADAAAPRVRITDPDDVPDPGAVHQGDENLDGVFGEGDGALVTPGAARDSYLVRRFLGHGTDRVRMPLGTSADNPTETNPPLTREESWVLMSWINCMQPGDGPYDEIRYDCPENADNEGQW